MGYGAAFVEKLNEIGREQVTEITDLSSGSELELSQVCSHGCRSSNQSQFSAIGRWRDFLSSVPTARAIFQRKTVLVRSTHNLDQNRGILFWVAQSAPCARSEPRCQ